MRSSKVFTGHNQLLTLFLSCVTRNDAFCSLSSDEEKEGPDEKKESREEEDEEEEMERKLAQLKAEEVAELKRYHAFWYFYSLYCLDLDF